MSKHPIQPLEKDKHGVVRFKENTIVSFLLERASAVGCDMNTLACMPFNQEDRCQFAQLIGYSLCGFGELSYVDDDTYNAAAAMKDKGVDEVAARIETLQAELDALRKDLREPMARLFGKHPSDLLPRGQ